MPLIIAKNRNRITNFQLVFVDSIQLPPSKIISDFTTRLYQHRERLVQLKFGIRTQLFEIEIQAVTRSV